MTEPGELLTTAELSEILNISMSTLYRWRCIENPPLKAKVIRSGRKNLLRWLRSEAEALLSREERETATEAGWDSTE